MLTTFPLTCHPACFLRVGESCAPLFIGRLVPVSPSGRQEGVAPNEGEGFLLVCGAAA
jgi:hypothetical protein